MSKYSIPKICTLNDRTVKILPSKTLKFQIILNVIDADTTGEKFKNLIFLKVKSFEGRFTKYGYIIEIFELVKVLPGIINILSFNASVTYDVFVKCKVMDIHIGNVFVGCRLKIIKGSSLGFDYTKNITIWVHMGQNSSNISDKFFTDRLYNIKCKKFGYNVNRPRYKITLKRKIRNKLVDTGNEIPVKHIINDRGNNIIFLDYNNKKHINNNLRELAIIIFEVKKWRKTMDCFW